MLIGRGEDLSADVGAEVKRGRLRWRARRQRGEDRKREGEEGRRSEGEGCLLQATTITTNLYIGLIGTI